MAKGESLAVIKRKGRFQGILRHEEENSTYVGALLQNLVMRKWFLHVAEIGDCDQMTRVVEVVRMGG